MPENIDKRTHLERRAVVGVVRANFAARRVLDGVIQSHGITNQQYNVLRILRGAGEPLPTMQVAARMIEPEPGITRLLRRLEKKGLIRRRTGSEDARRIFCELTPKGRSIVDELDDPVDGANAQIMRRLADEEMHSLIDLLDRLSKSAGLTVGNG